MRRLSVRVAVAASVGVGLVAGPTASATAGRTGLRGSVSRGPVAPVCRAGRPCRGPAANAVLVFRRGLALVRAATDVQGRYLVVLAPGVWSVSTRSGVRIAPMRVRVVEGRMRGVDFAIDTGIR